MTRHYEILMQTQDESIAQVLPAVLALVPGVETVLVQTAGEAAEYLRGHRPDLVVLDLDWPHVFDLDTIKVLARDAFETVRAVAGSSSVPVVGISSELSHGQMMELGLADGIQKPFDIAEVEARIERILTAEAATASMGKEQA